MSWCYSQNPRTIAKTLNILRPGGHLVSISVPPDSVFAEALGLNVFLKLVMRLLSRGVPSKAKSLGIHCSLLFMHADGQQLDKIAGLIDSGALLPVVDRIFPFNQTSEALANVETGRAKGKVVIKVQ